MSQEIRVENRVGARRMILGVSREQEKIIAEILKNFFGQFSFFYYGSRVKGGFEATSDLDILIKSVEKVGEVIEPGIIEQIEENFYQSRLPYIVNLTDYSNIEPSFYRMIEGSLVRIE